MHTECSATQVALRKLHRKHDINPKEHGRPTVMRLALQQVRRTECGDNMHAHITCEFPPILVVALIHSFNVAAEKTPNLLANERSAPHPFARLSLYLLDMFYARMYHRPSSSSPRKLPNAYRILRCMHACVS